MNHMTDAFSQVLKLARDKGPIEDVPEIPRTSRKDNPRPSFRFYPLAPKEEDAYRKLLETAKNMESSHDRYLPLSADLVKNLQNCRR